MARKSLRSSLNQIRTWVRQGRTDAWIAHQLEVPAAQLRDFKRQHGLEAGDGEPEEFDLRDEIEAEVEAAAAAEAESEDEADEAEESEPADSEQEESSDDGERPRRRRRRRGRGRGRGRGKALEAVFDHGERDGYGLWLDAAIKDDATYAEHWAGHSRLRVEIQADRIVLRRSDEDSEDAGGPDPSDDDE